MALWLRLNDRLWVDRDKFIVCRVREDVNDDSWVVEGLNADGAIKLHSPELRFESKIEAEEYLEAIMSRNP